MVHSSDEAHRVDETLPGMALARSDAPALGGQTVGAASSLDFSSHRPEASHAPRADVMVALPLLAQVRFDVNAISCRVITLSHAFAMLHREVRHGDKRTTVK
jgi:hypothetical protein